MANPQEVVKTKSINRTFQLEANDELEVDNKYGEITVAHWERNEVLIQVEIESRAASEKVAQANLDRITIEMNQWGHGIKAETIIASNKGNWSHGNASFSTRSTLPKSPFTSRTSSSPPASWPSGWQSACGTCRRCVSTAARSPGCSGTRRSDPS